MRERYVEPGVVMLSFSIVLIFGLLAWSCLYCKKSCSVEDPNRMIELPRQRTGSAHSDTHDHLEVESEGLVGIV